MTATPEVKKIAMVMKLVDNDPTVTPELAGIYLRLAADKIIRRRYPFGTERVDVPAQYEAIQCRLAARMLDRRGIDGELAHTENAVSRSYGSADDADILSGIVPLGRVL